VPTHAANPGKSLICRGGPVCPPGSNPILKTTLFTAKTQSGTAATTPLSQTLSLKGEGFEARSEIYRQNLKGIGFSFLSLRERTKVRGKDY